MIQYTTPTVGVRLKNIELDETEIVDVNLTLQPIDKTTRGAKGEPLVIDDPDVSVVDGKTLVTKRLTQTQSASLPVGLVEEQVNWKFADGTRGACKPVYIQITKNLYAREM